jgi:hypothetical protein
MIDGGVPRPNAANERLGRGVKGGSMVSAFSVSYWLAGVSK